MSVEFGLLAVSGRFLSMWSLSLYLYRRVGLSESIIQLNRKSCLLITGLSGFFTLFSISSISRENFFSCKSFKFFLFHIFYSSSSNNNNNNDDDKNNNNNNTNTGLNMANGYDLKRFLVTLFFFLLIELLKSCEHMW